MDNSYLTNPLVFLVQAIFGLYLLIVMLRFLLQIVRADFYNPVSQFIVKVTTPVLRPLRSVIPGIGGIDVSSLVLAWLIKAVELFLILVITGKGAVWLYPLLQAIPALIELTLNIFLFAVLIMVILSWLSPGGYNPAISLLQSLTEPLLRPARKVMPDLGGLDLSPVLVMIVLALLKMLIIPPLEQLALSVSF